MSIGHDLPAETCACLEDAERARTLLAALTPYANRMALIDRAHACKGSVHQFLGLLAANTFPVMLFLIDANARCALTGELERTTGLEPATVTLAR